MIRQKLITQTDFLARPVNELLTGTQNKVLLVIAGHIAARHAASNLLAPLLGANTQIAVKKRGDVSLDEVEEVYAGLDPNNLDRIITIGGGSVIDLAKCLLNKLLLQDQSRPQFIAVPTTAGSGSEATCFAVYYDKKVKYSLDKPSLLPDIAILDHGFLQSLSADQIAISGIDAMAHAVESYWNINATDESKEICQKVISTILTALPAAIESADRLEFLSSLSEASYQAGKAINITRTTGGHALSYYLSGEYGISHGQAVAIFLPVLFMYNAGANPDNCNHPGGPKAVHDSIDELNSIFNCSTADESCKFLQSFIRRIGLAATLHELSLNDEGLIERIVKNVNFQRFNNNPVMFNESALISLCKNLIA
ncbi:MAG: iron-containing alcohol dehydrogenase [Pseudobacter sp.]|uniref:iron-containing alcohol dehydrogenase n=1 Tax=Pseudobacter sp. TaxID=2045420 RepID=UPI003F7CDAA1